MKPARLLVAAAVMWVFIVLCANVALKGHVTPSGIASAFLGIVIIGILLFAAGVFSSAGRASREEEAREANRNREHGHRADGDPR